MAVDCLLMMTQSSCLRGMGLDNKANLFTAEHYHRRPLAQGLRVPRQSRHCRRRGKAAALLPVLLRPGTRELGKPRFLTGKLTF
jgi:hypothetical protein